MFTWKQRADGLSFVGEVEISAVETFQDVILEATKEPRELALDLSRVSRLDTAASQVLLALCRSPERYRSLTLKLSPAVAETLQRLGLSEYIRPFLAEGAKQ